MATAAEITGIEGDMFICDICGEEFDELTLAGLCPACEAEQDPRSLAEAAREESCF